MVTVKSEDPKYIVGGKTMKAVYGIDEVAERYAVSQKTIRRWVKAKKFPAPNHFGRRRRWLVKSLERFDDSTADRSLMAISEGD